ncbi:hypothetical protein O3M35_006264 [Rhynocoris fuscipes]|uniref:Soluble calcium-activated nucleotidase 1 n=1 Tax=Rhynocoris fuscipes TaxID=488301 RepID=A0AAW1DK08_9HEMI
MALKDWRKAIRTPPSYRVGKTTLKMQAQCVIFIAVLSVVVLFIIYRSSDNGESKKIHGYGVHNLDLSNSEYQTFGEDRSVYNSTYPITKPLHTHDGIMFKIGAVSDMDQSSLSKLESNTWMSQYLKGTLIWNSSTQTITVTWDPAGVKTLKTKYSYSGRGMELSELVTFDGKLLSVDDRSGIVYIIEDEKVYPWVILLDGPGKVNKVIQFILKDSKLNGLQ